MTPGRPLPPRGRPKHLFIDGPLIGVRTHLEDPVVVMPLTCLEDVQYLRTETGDYIFDRKVPLEKPTHVQPKPDRPMLP
jgi:hypothetical protein